MADEIRKEVIVDVKIENADNEKQVDTLTKRIVELRQETGELVDANRQLAKSGKDNTKEYLENAKQIEINKQKISENTASRKSLITTLTAEDNSIKALQVRNRELIKQRNQITTATAEGRAQIALMNAEIDKNNETIKVNSSSLEKQRMNVGAYKKDVIKALKEINIGGINIGGVLDTLDDTNEALQGTVQGYKEAGIGAKLFGTTARTAMTLTGIGILIAGLATIVVYWDDITDAIGVTDNASRKHFEAFKKNLDESNEKLRKQVELLEAQGAEQELIKTIDLFEKRRQLREAELNLAKEQAKEQRTITTRTLDGQILTIGGTKKQSEAEKELIKITQDLSHEIGVLEAELDQLDLTRATQDKESVKKANDEAKKARQDRYNQEAKEFHEQQVRKKEEIQNINSELRAIDEAEYDRRTEQGQIVSDAQIEQMNETHRQELEAQQAHNEEMSMYYDADAEAKLLAEEKKREAVRQNINEAVDMAQGAADALVGLARVRADNEIKKIRELEEKKILTKEQAEAKIEEIERKSFKRSKALAIIQAIVNTAQAVIAAFAPPPTGAGPVFGPIFAGIAAVTGAIQIATIKAQEFAKGGLVLAGFADGGLSGTKIMNHHGTPINRSNGDNRLATVRTGEVILNERQQAALGGADTFRKIGVPGFADGGFTGYAQTNIAYKAAANNDIERTVRSVMQNFPAVYVSVTDINNGQSQFAEVIDRARL